MARQTKKSLINRWNFGGPMDFQHSPFGVTDHGLRDFRGFPYAAFKRAGRLMMPPGSFTAKCDFNCSDFAEIELDGNRFVECEFTSVDFDGFIDRGCHFDHCNFQRCTFKRANFGFRESHYDGCRFEGCKFIEPSMMNAVFKDCAFIDNRMYSFFCEGTGFWRCEFVGLLEDIVFLGSYNFREDEARFGVLRYSGLHHVDWSQARLRFIEVGNECVLENITLPSDGSAVILDRTVFIERVSELRQLFPDLAFDLNVLCGTIASRKRQSQVIVSLLDAIEEVGEGNAEMIYAAISSGVMPARDKALR